MLLDGQFLFDSQLIAGLESLIKESKENLILISPYIDLSVRIRTALQTKLDNKDFKLTVVFGKNEEKYFRSIKKDSLEFLMQFPNIEIRYEERLHAKYYESDFHFIVSSMNLYDYSHAKNIEFGLIVKHTSKSLLGKVSDAANDLSDAVGEKITGKSDVDPIVEFERIIQNSKLMYKTEPILVDAGGLKGIVGLKKLDGKNVVVNEFEKLLSVNEATPIPIKNNSVQKELTKDNVTSIIGKHISKSQLSKQLGIPAAKIQLHFENIGYIKDDKPTELGEQKGLKLLKGQYANYIGYPEEMEELHNIK
jgi:hypothetical protein